MPYRILVSIKRVPDYEVKVRLLSDGSGIQTDGIKWIINPFDEIAVEEAIRIREKVTDVEVVVASIGPAAVSEQIRAALAMGADRGIHVLTDEAVDSASAAQILAALYKREEFQLVILGKQAIDSDSSQTGPMLAAELGLPQATFASKIEIGGTWASADVTREVDGGLETIRVSIPAVITTDLRLNEPRYPSLPGIVKAKKKPLEELQVASLGLSLQPRIRVLKMELPPGRKAGVKVGSPAELVEKLKNEAKVI